MCFNSYDFALFFAALFPAYWLLTKWPRIQNIVLLSAGYYFYACWNPRSSSHCSFSRRSWITLADSGVDLVESPKRRRPGRRGSVDGGSNLGMLGYFKYVQFLCRKLAGRGLQERAGLSISLHHL